MSTLSVSSLQNTASPVVNIGLNTDGSSTLALYNLGLAPTPVVTGTLWYDVSGAGLVIWDGVGWVGVGGGGGVTSVTASAPLAASAGATPNITATLASAAQAAAGTSNVVLSTPEFTVPKDAAGMAGAALLPGSAAAYVGTPATGMIRYNSTTLPAVIEYYSGSAWVALGAGSTAASLAEAAAGTINTKFLSPETGVPKNGAGMTGAAILPSGTDLQRAAIATPVVGMQRFNTTSGFEEVYTGATLGWQSLAFNTSISPSPTDLTLSGATSLDPSYLCKNLTVSAGATLTSDSQGVYIRATGDVTINASTWTFVGVTGAASVNAGGGASLSAAGFGLGAGLPTPAISRPYSTVAQPGGSSGASGTAASGNNRAGGNAGGYCVIIADGNITFNGAVTINCNGSGAAGGGTGGGGGGGSGGCIILSTPKTLTTPATVTLQAAGGNGTNGVNAGTDAGGGGGGGGGWIILQSGNLVDSSTKVLTGGLAGTTTGGGPILGGGGGGSYAGAGGRGGSTGLAVTNGSPGIFATGYYPS